ncbi:hypothetical protein ACFLUO_09175 [Chloroflexota bacterium]
MEEAPTQKKGRLVFRKRTMFTMGLLILFISFVIRSVTFPFGAGLFPLLIGSSIIILLLLQLSTELLGKEENVEILDVAVEEAAKGKVAMLRAVRFFAWILGVYAGIFLVGFNITILAFYILFMRLEGRINWWLILILTAVASVLQLYYFPRVIGMLWPTGLIHNIFPDLPL